MSGGDRPARGPGQGAAGGLDAAGAAEGGPAEGDRPRLSVVIGAQDEEDRLPRCLASVSWADEIVVVDAGSRDRTVEVARTGGARVEELDGWPGDGPQKQRALDLARGEWVLVLDADEVVSGPLAGEIRELLAEGPEAAGYELLFHTRFLGRWLGRRGWYRERHLRLVRKDRARVTPDRVHARLEVDGPVDRLRHPVLHYTNRDVAHHQRKARLYSSMKASRLHREGRRTSLAGAAGHAMASFVSGYLVRGRFLDGWAGLIHEALGAHATLLAYLKLWELGREEGRAGGPAREERESRGEERSSR